MKRETLPRAAAWNLFLALAVFLLPLRINADSVLNSKHNLSVNGPGGVKASTETDVCIFCHTPHRASTAGPLWNHATSSASYTPYSSPTMKAVVGQPNGASKLCLSCHDGTVALGMVNSRTANIAMQGGVTVMPAGSSNVGTDLSQDHPISFTYNSALAAAVGNLADPSTLTGKVRLDANGQMQCTACHNPHDNQYGNFLVMADTGSTLCSTCHIDSLWAASNHATSTASIATVTTTLSARRASTSSLAQRTAKAPMVKAVKTVAANGCNNCHATHGAGGRKRLLLTSREEKTCFTCHNGTTVRQRIEPEFNKISTHPVLQTSNLHDPSENLLTAPRHVSCSDCHNSHAARKSSGQTARAAESIREVKGVNRSGAIVNTLTREYELCFRCHSDNATRKAATVNRVSPQTNMRQAFSTSNRSYHPVVEVGKNTNVPSLLSPYTTSSIILCTSCHNNDQGPGAGGPGPNGPHGSAFAPLLERRLQTTDYIGESVANYALCYKCHSRNSILSDQSFRAMNRLGQSRGHRFHIVEQKAACTTCHDSHGAANNKHLINFNPSYVTASSTGRIEYASTGLFRGNCTLTCHGANHSAASYPDSIAAGSSLVRGKR